MADGKEYSVEVFDGQRAIESGETVLLFDASYTVVDVEKDDITLQPENGRKKDIIKVKRDKLAVTRGCSLQVCVTDPVYNIARGRMESVAGITFDGDVITKDINGKMSGGALKLSQLAPAKGCVLTRDKKSACVGDTVMASNNSYYEIIAVQYDQNVVVRSTDQRNGAVYANRDAASFVVVK